MSIRLIPLVTAVLPIVAIHATYIISASQGYVPWCFPYIDSCTSISATGRDGASFYIFKGTIIPQAMILILFWLLCYRWLISLGDHYRGARLLVIVGIIGAVFLIVYTVALGAAGDYFRLQRRIGIIVYFMFTYLGQLLLTWRLGKLAFYDATRPGQLVLCYTLLAIGLTTIALNLTLENYEDYEDAFEWVAALLIHIYFLVIWRAWKNTGFEVRYTTSPPADEHGKGT